MSILKFKFSLNTYFIFGFALTIVLITFGCPKAKEKTKFRIAVATFSHETCTFCPGETSIEDWEYYGPPTRDFIHTDRGYIGGFKAVCEEYGNIELVPLTSPRDARGGSSGSWITQEAFDKYSGLIVEEAKALGPFDGVFLALHGAMAVRGIPKPEAELVRRVRQAVGRIPIMVTLDLHANEDHELAEAADAVFICKRYPHYDTYLTGEIAARVMIKTIKGQYKPIMAVRKTGVITPSVFQGTGTSPAMEIMERARIWECEYPGTYVSVAFGFAYADVPDVGATVMVVTNNNRDLAEKIAQDMSDFIWRLRHVFAGKKLPKTKEGVALAIMAAKEGKTPVIIADHSDRTGGSTHILEELIRQGAKNFCVATLRDERALEEIQAKYKVGDSISINLGGYSDEFAGNPVRVDGQVEYIGKFGREAIAVIRFGHNNRVIITPVLMQVTEPSLFKALNIDLKELAIIVLKSRVHFRRGFVDTGLAGAVLEVDAPGWGPADLTVLPYQNIPKDIYPIYRKD
ncbi:MAG: M81 family metallopeptidase [Candidatus Aminicenantes bacterium]|nr:M81 family metallopeptidase [Candidatus Aminicenantes bacterium]